MRAAAAVAAVLGLLVFAKPAAAEVCSDTLPVIVRGTQWVVYTGDSQHEVSCTQARQIALRMLRSHKRTRGWRCSARLQRCVRGAYADRRDAARVGWHYFD